MWPMLLNMTRDECRRTLRRLELEAYSNMISVFRAQGALEDNRKKLLEELRAVLHISADRHSAEARRVSNDELLATIAEQLAGPNTGLGWICEGRRRIPLLPRGVAQTMYTEMADKVAETVAEENKETQKKLEEKLVAPKSSEEQISDAEGRTAESVPTSDVTEEYTPVAMEDESLKLWETELITRKRKVSEVGSLPDDSGAAPPVKNMRNIPVNTNQKHLNLSQIYSKFSQPATSKSSQSKHSYNQVSKVSTSKSSQSHTSQTPHKQHRAPKRAKNPAPIVVSKSQVKKPQDILISPNKYNQTQVEYAGPPNTFQASYAQAVLGSKSLDDMKSKGMTDSPTMQLLTQPAATVPHELAVAENVHPDDPAMLQAQATPTKHSISGKPCTLIIKNRGEITSSDKKMQMSDVKVLQKPPAENVKLLTNKQVVVAPGSTQKPLSTPGRIVTTKVISSLPKSRSTTTPISTEKMIVVSKPAENKNIGNSKIIISSSTITTPTKNVPLNNTSPKVSEAFTPKGIPATDLKVSAKTVVLNSKSGQKMVVLPAKTRTKSGNEGQLPMLPIHFKGLPAMKLVPVSSHPAASSSRSSTVTVVSSKSSINTMTPKKILGVEPIKTANLADIVPSKTPTSTPKITNPIVRPVSAKGNVIVVQKGASLGKAIAFSKSSSDMSKIIMGKNVNQLLQASKPDQAETAKVPGNVIVLELNNEQTGRTTTMSEILDSRNTGHAANEGKKLSQEITQDTPVLFDSQITEETCNANSLDSTSESIGEIVQMEESGLSIIEKNEGKDSYNKDSEGAKDSSSVTDWEMELDTVSRKDKDDDDKLNSLHLDLGMSSDSENEYIVATRKAKSKHTSQRSVQATPSGGSSVYSSSSGMSLATRTLLSQLQDDGSSSNDSSFALKAKSEKVKDSDIKIDKSEREALTKAKEKLSEKVAESQQKRIDVYSTAISTSDINLDSFSYLEEGMMAGDDEFGEESKAREERQGPSLDEQLSRLLGEDSASDSHTPSETIKQ